jgi:hypothetical protein
MSLTWDWSRGAIKALYDAATGLDERVEDLEATPPGGGSAHVIQDEGTPLTARAALNFVGSAVEVTDDSGNDRTTVTVSAAGLTHPQILARTMGA